MNVMTKLVRKQTIKNILVAIISDVITLGIALILAYYILINFYM
jgi:hypothetical protein